MGRSSPSLQVRCLPAQVGAVSCSAPGCAPPAHTPTASSSAKHAARGKGISGPGSCLEKNAKGSAACLAAAAGCLSPPIKAPMGRRRLPGLRLLPLQLSVPACMASRRPHSGAPGPPASPRTPCLPLSEKGASTLGSCCCRLCAHTIRTVSPHGVRCGPMGCPFSPTAGHAPQLQAHKACL